MLPSPTIALLIDHMDLGGAQLHVEALAEGIAGDLRPVVGCLRHRGVVGDRLLARGISVTDFKARGRIGAHALRAIRCWLLQEHVALLHTHLFSASLWGRLAGRASRVPATIVTQHNLWSPRPIKHFIPDRWLGIQTDHWIAPSPAVAESLHRNLGVHNIEMIPHGIDLERFHHIDAERRTAARTRFRLAAETQILGFVGRLSTEKEVALLLGAVALARHRLPRLQLIVAGDGPEQRHLRREALDSGIAAAVHWYGTLTGAELEELYAAVDGIALPGRCEGFGLAALEALASARPVIGAVGSGVADLVHQCSGGIAFKPGSTSDLARAIVELLSKPETSGAMGHAARRATEGFSRERMVRSTLALYQQVIALRSSLAPASKSMPPPRKHRMRRGD
jgi:glycosyltransferase involved in cell wall biosynthesis